ncbi:hypothetical protein TNCT_424121 [Trichonephila clavata]|uniref:Uncharacterized protein n=1 Tax=Trichonephila clavata TaxID=2740835 RepID=A0A8X6FML0_TRICU|nr:hypothetical protein TNCT_424121 [Trichonephila clavata]
MGAQISKRLCVSALSSANSLCQVSKDLLGQYLLQWMDFPCLSSCWLFTGLLSLEKAQRDSKMSIQSPEDLVARISLVSAYFSEMLGIFQNIRDSFYHRYHNSFEKFILPSG